ncbi:helix-turn-helix domain-containing GNAT family N-acetyltransferase [Streptomyces sp. NPDC004232]|uniref:helix-turn-helix domain-containing GNAT family N-acetyltransferase n=1 Tax=Streptomyces sp. NPDC004232 TaxID=3154454 RepID=UPI001DA04DBC|nr:helix-turn-helix domain-containing GNAT family N-acetyltransferase [Streptomyces sp. tea 10]
MTVQDILAVDRVLSELAHADGTDEAGLRARLGLTDGHLTLTRILDAVERAGLVERDSSGTRVVLTASGRGIAEALRALRTVLGDTAPQGPAEVALREPRPGDLGWIVQRNAALYAAEYGWNADYEGLVARIVADFAEDHDPHLERVWIAELGGRPVGCVMCVRDDAPGTARLRLLLVEPEARGHGIGDLLVGAVVDFARGVGYRDLVLWTNDVLGAARRVYLRHGFVLTAEQPHRSFGKDLIGQDWRLDLHRSGE